MNDTIKHSRKRKRDNGSSTYPKGQKTVSDWMKSITSDRQLREWQAYAQNVSEKLCTDVMNHKKFGYRVHSKSGDRDGKLIWPLIARIVRRVCNFVTGVTRPVRRVSKDDFKIGKRPYLSLCGRSGCGKSTLIQTIAQVSGIQYIHLLGRDIPRNARTLGNLLFMGEPKIIEITAAYSLANNESIKKFMDSSEKSGRCPRWPVIFSSSDSPAAVYTGHLFSVFAHRCAHKVSMPECAPVKWCIALAVKTVGKNKVRSNFDYLLRVAGRVAQPDDEYVLRDFIHRMQMIQCADESTPKDNPECLSEVSDEGAFAAGKISWVEFIRDVFSDHADPTQRRRAESRAEAIIQDGGSVIQSGTTMVYAGVVQMNMRAPIHSISAAISSASDFDVLYENMDGFREANAHPIPGVTETLSWFSVQQIPLSIRASSPSVRSNTCHVSTLSRCVKDGKRVLYGSFGSPTSGRTTDRKPLAFFTPKFGKKGKHHPKQKKGVSKGESSRRPTDSARFGIRGLMQMDCRAHYIV